MKAEKTMSAGSVYSSRSKSPESPYNTSMEGDSALGTATRTPRLNEMIPREYRDVELLRGAFSTARINMNRFIFDGQKNMIMEHKREVSAFNRPSRRKLSSFRTLDALCLEVLSPKNQTPNGTRRPRF